MLRCLDANPKRRPASALALAAALPGGDPLVEALAAGETPSPEMVAASGTTEALRPGRAIGLLALVAVQLAAFGWLASRVVVNHLPLENPPEVLAAKARDIIRSLGYTDRPVDFATGFAAEAISTPGRPSYHIEYMAHQVSGSFRTRISQWRLLLSKSPSPAFFWYRQSPEPIISPEPLSEENPAPTLPGMVSVEVTLDGHLLRFIAVQTPGESSDEEKIQADWPAVFAVAGLDINQFRSAKPESSPLTATDLRAAWTGPYTNYTDLPVRVEAAAFHGKPVYFEVRFPWTATGTCASNEHFGVSESV